MTTNLASLTPAEVDALWLDARQPINARQERLSETRTSIRRYEKHNTRVPDYLSEREAQLLNEIAELLPSCAPFQAEWDRRGGWSRAYVVPGGHIHRSTSCSSLHPTTLIGWLPEQSGWDEDAIVDAAGIHACTICYPSAPVDALRAAEAAAKKATQCPGSGTWDHDSSGLRYCSPRAVCNHCRQTTSVTSTGKLRGHKPVAA